MRTPDRRTRKTQAALKEILIDLLKQKEIEKISVTEICRLADINRSTFYLHYCDIYALLEAIEEECLAEFDLLVAYISCHEIVPHLVTRMILKFIYNQKELLYLLLSGHNKAGFWEKMNKKIIYLFKMKTLQIYELPGDMDEEAFDDMILFYASGFYAIYRKWLLHNCREDIDTIAKRSTLYSQICFDHILIRK